MRYLFVLILVVSMFPPSASAEGLDELFAKPSERKSWNQQFAEMVGYDSGFSKSYALVIGISKYAGYKNLPTDQDPLRVRDFLLASGFDEVHVLTEEKVTLGRLRTLMVDEFPRKVDGNDRFLLYWSGHGVERNNTLGGQTGYLPLANSNKESFASMASMDDISRWDGFLDARHVLYLIDACFGGLAGLVSQSSQSELVVEQMLKPARFLLTAGAADEEVIASDKWGGSLFTHALLSGLAGAADTSSKEFPSDGVISLFELISHIKKRVAVERNISRWPKPITPQLRDLRGSDGEFFFLTSNFIRPNLPLIDKSATTTSKSGLDISPPDKVKEEAASHRSKCVDGDGRSCTLLGYLYEYGLGVARNGEKAVLLYRQGCDGGSAEGCTKLGAMYYRGNGVALDPEKAVSLYRQGCDGGDARACENLKALEIIQSIGR